MLGLEEKTAWLANLGVTVLPAKAAEPATAGADPDKMGKAGSDAGSAPAPGGGGAAPAPPKAGAAVATDTDLFFDQDSADLTASDTAALDAYVQAFANAGGSDPITVDGYASLDGTAKRNQELAHQRAQAVLKYLVDKGIAAARMTAKGHGPTADFSKDDPRANRRVTLAPKPPAPAKPAAPSDPATPSTLDMRPNDAPTATPPSSITPTWPLLSPEDLQKIVGTDTSVSRKQVERELTDFFEKLQTAQHGKSLKITGTVRHAGAVLAKGLGDSELQVDTALRNDTINVMPNELAHKIAGMLPERIPRENFDNFLKLKPEEIKPPEKLSFSGAIAKLLSPAVHKAVAFLPKDMREKVEKGVADAVAAGLVKIADQAMSGTNLDEPTKTAIHNAVEAAIKQKPDTPPGKTEE